MMRFVVPAIALSLSLHAALLAWAGKLDAVEYGAESAVSSMMIVFDAPRAAVASASANAEEAAMQQPAKAADRPAQALPDDAETEHPALQPEPEITPEPEIAPAPAAEPASPQPAATTIDVPVPRPRPALPAALVKKPLSSEKPARQKAQRRTVQKTASASAGKNKAQRRSGSAGRSGGASAGQKAAYARRVLAHIQRHKRFPPGASAGKVSLKVRISATGTLQSVAVRRSSGHRVLDRAALATARRASPYPKPPGGRSFSFTVALRYKR